MSDLGPLPRRKKAGAGRVITEKPRSEPTPGSEADFLTRIQLALDRTPKELANVLGISYREVVDRVGPRSAMSSFVTDPLWGILSEYINERIAGMLAVKDELDRKARLDYREHAARVARIKNRS